MKHLRHVSLCLLVVAGCSELSQPSAPPMTVGEVIQSCVESSGQKLDAAQAGGDIAATAREILKFSTILRIRLKWLRSKSLIGRWNSLND